MRQLTLTIAILAAAAGLHAEEPTYAERLGWPKGARVLMIHADDMGMSLSSNQGCIETFEAGTVTSASVMMTCPWVPGVMAWYKRNPDACLGVHLTHTAEWDEYRWAPVAGRANVPGLVDPNGYMHDSAGLVAANASADEVEAEIRAQIALAEQVGLPISHIDTHMGVLFETPEFLERYMKVALEKQIPMLMAGGHLTQAREDFGEDMVNTIKVIAETVWNAGLPVLDDLDTRTYSWEGTDKTDEYIDAIRTLPPGVTWLNTHPTAPLEEGKRITANREKLWGDYYALIDPKVMEAIEEEGVILTSWKELMERRAAVE